MPQYRYEPKDNRTPMFHPLIGELVWGETYDHPACADNPDFVEVKAAGNEPKTAAEQGADIAIRAKKES